MKIFVWVCLFIIGGVLYFYTQQQNLEKDVRKIRILKGNKVMTIKMELLPENLYDERADKMTGEPIAVDMLLLHCSSYSKDDMVKVLKKEGLSAHYIVETDGTVTQLVDEKYRAWHAGVGSWAGVQNINAHSIGIEIVNPTLGHMKPYPDRQIEQVIQLSQDIINRHHILPHNVIAHSDLAPTRKFDPGRLFPWAKLAQAGVGLYPERQPQKGQPTETVKELLVKIGYPVDNEKAALRAFVRHFMPEMIPDIEYSGQDYFNFLWHYEENLPTVLEKQHFDKQQILSRLTQVANLYQQSRNEK